ncbi:hypothetical protein TGAM01_v201879 [Trichoderma gamsii]|uniref:Altered inheritance of mitochondria protein 11 n=1 Tax=Trichoderma gamsii TaxID=398673 RepID=A0A0W7VGF9_9HYPO|nr:hypothetical protein TGAM01_v201879 [Trichoderma gamsii]PNP37279.1 hypothetical protein TGAMA5MH_10848 [Trichoderma gamsii]PON29629.1 hypothetical protein TGAM01_v201879 [Trichoderma gamsii]
MFRAQPQAMSQEGSASSPPQSIRRQPDINAYSASWSRPLKQFSLFFLGAAFTAASVGVSRRSVVRRQRDSFPRFYTSNRPGPEDGNSSEGALLGLHALGLATLNVSSFAVLLTGGLSWAFDLSSVDELRTRTKAALQRPGGEVSPEDEKEFEQMIDNLMAKLGMDKVSNKDGDDGNQKDSGEK